MYATTGCRKRARRVVSVVNSNGSSNHTNIITNETGRPTSHPISIDKGYKRIKPSGMEESPFGSTSTPSPMAPQQIAYLVSSSSFFSNSFDSVRMTKESHPTISFPTHTGSHHSPRSSTTSLSSLCSDATIDSTCCFHQTEESSVVPPLPSSSSSPPPHTVTTAATVFVTRSCQQPHDGDDDGSHLWISRRSKQWMRILFVFAFAVALFATVTSEQTGAFVLSSSSAIHKTTWPRVGWQSRTIPDANSVCVSGGGFSGFWYTLGRLESIPDRSAKTYFCYSAGCLGVVASLSNYTMEQMWNMAYSVQMRWKRGEISRYQVVDAFLNDLLYVKVGTPNSTSNTTGSNVTPVVVPVLDEHNLSLLNIITSVKSGRMGLAPSVRTPTSIESLRTMLIQTSWIPLAIGDDLWYDDHMDGAFTVGHHPACEHHVGLTLNWDLYVNVVNVNLGRTKVETFWNKGLSRGL